MRMFVWETYRTLVFRWAFVFRETPAFGAHEGGSGPMCCRGFSSAFPILAISNIRRNLHNTQQQFRNVRLLHDSNPGIVRRMRTRSATSSRSERTSPHCRGQVFSLVRGSKLNDRRGKPQVLVHVFPLPRPNPFWNSGFLEPPPDPGPKLVVSLGHLGKNNSEGSKRRFERGSRQDGKPSCCKSVKELFSGRVSLGDFQNPSPRPPMSTVI